MVEEWATVTAILTVAALAADSLPGSVHLILATCGLWLGSPSSETGPGIR